MLTVTKSVLSGPDKTLFVTVNGRGVPVEGSARDVLAFSEHYYAGIADVEAAGPILLVVDADADAGRHDHAFVDDDPTQLSAAADIDAVQQHGAFDDGAAVHLHAR